MILYYYNVLSADIPYSLALLWQPGSRQALIRC